MTTFFVRMNTSRAPEVIVRHGKSMHLVKSFNLGADEQRVSDASLGHLSPNVGQALNQLRKIQMAMGINEHAKLEGRVGPD